MAKLIKDGLTVETVFAPEIVSLRARGFMDAEAADPAETKAPDVPAVEAKTADTKTKPSK